MSTGLPNAGSATSVGSAQEIELEHLQAARQACRCAQCILQDACEATLGIETALVSVGSRNSERKFLVSEQGRQRCCQLRGLEGCRRGRCQGD